MASKRMKKTNENADLQAAASLLTGILRTGYVRSEVQDMAVRFAAQLVVKLRAELKLNTSRGERS